MKQFRAIIHLSCYFVLSYLSQGGGAFAEVSEGRSNDKTTESSKACTVMQDGSCIVEEETAELDEMKTVEPLPDFNETGFIQLKYGEAQQIISQTPGQSEASKRFLVKMHNYMYGDVYVSGQSQLRQDCLLRHELCVFWASIGECTANPAYMTIQCAPACLSCDQLLFETRCPMADNIEESNIWKPNDLNIMFQNISTNKQYGKIDVLTKPGMAPPNKDATFKDSPWVVTVDEFLTPEECDMFIKLGADRGYEVSRDVGARKFDGTYEAITSEGRTSTNTWCQDDCSNNSFSQNVFQKIVNLTGIPDENSEYHQLLRYEVGQFYQQHHDYIEHHVQRQQGVRIVTVFIYLNDVEEGGGTNFPLLNLTVLPKRGRVLIWPSVLNENPSLKDFRTDHQALPVIKGIKYASNAWLHLRDFKTPFNKSCV